MAGFRAPSSLRLRLSLSMSGLVVLCTVVCLAGAVLFLNRALTDRATSDLQRALTGVNGYLDNQKSDLLGTAKLVADDPAVHRAVSKEDSQGLIVYLTPFYADLNADVMDVIDAHGRVLARMEDTLTNGDSVLRLKSVRNALAGGQSVALEADLPQHEAAGGYALRATVPIRVGRRVVGAVVVGRQLGSIFAAHIGHALDANVNLIAGGERTGSTLTDSHGLPTAGVREDAATLRRIATGAQSLTAVDEASHASLSGIVPLRDASGRPVGAIEIVRPLDPLYDVIKSLSFLLIALGAVVVVVGTVLALDIARRVTSRLQVLEATASRVAAMAGEEASLGELHIGVPVHGRDEVASLARSFSAMMTALDERIAANAQLYAAAQSRLRELSGLAEIARLLTVTSSLSDTMEVLGEDVCRLVGCSAVAIWLPGEAGFPALHGGHNLPDDYERLSREMAEEGNSASFELTAQTALRTGEVVSLAIGGDGDARANPRRVALFRALRAKGLVRASSVPLRVGGRTVGALTCYTESIAPMPNSDLGLLTTIADQVAVAVENARLSEQAQAAAALQERQRLARELHDSVSQALYGIALGAKTARTLLDRNPAGAATPLEYVLSQAAAGLAEMRALIFELRPEALEAEGLVAALDKQAESLRARHGLSVRCSLASEPDIPFTAKEALYRIGQEAMHNTVKHAHARSVSIGLYTERGQVVLEIEDDGRGFDPAASYVGHLGLRTMRERAERLGGTINMDSAAGSGTRIRASVPATMSGVA